MSFCELESGEDISKVSRAASILLGKEVSPVEVGVLLACIASIGLLKEKKPKRHNTSRPADIKQRKGKTLDKTKVKDIRRQLKFGAPAEKLAAQYGVCTSTISDVKLGRTWKKC